MLYLPWVLFGCTAPAPPDDTGETGDTGDTGETGETGDPCPTSPDPARPTDFSAVMGRLASQGCLDEADIALAVAALEVFHAEEPVWCDAVVRLASPDGLWFSGEPEPVRAHASVPDALIAADGRHVVVFNELDPTLFEATLRVEPARFWRQGLVGLGGLGMVVERGDAWEEPAVDLHLASPAIVVDPDLALRPAGDYRLVTFNIEATALDGVSWDPFGSPKPHRFVRAVGAAYTDLPAPEDVVASEVGTLGGADPTVLDDGADERLFAGDFTAPMMGWSAPGGVYPALGTPPDIGTGLAAMAPDVTTDPTGGWRLYFFDPGGGGIQLATSSDGRGWRPEGPVIDAPGAGAPSVVRAADGTWWMYFVIRDAACAAEWADSGE